LSFHRGSELQYRWDLGDGTSKNTKWVSHQYSSPGIYLVSVFVFNQISNASDSLFMVIQDSITGLRMIGDIEPTMPNKFVNIQWNIDKGLFFVD